MINDLISPFSAYFVTNFDGFAFEKLVFEKNR